MSELEARADIAGGEYTRIRSAQPGIDFDSSRRVAYSGCFQIESLQIGCATDRNQDGVATKVRCHLLDSSSKDFFMAIFGGALNPGSCNDTDAVLFHPLAYDPRGVGIFSGQYLGAVGQQCRLAAEAGECLRHFATDRAGADDDNSRRQFGQRENSFIGKIANFGEAWNREFGRPGAAGYDGAVKMKTAAVHVYR